MQKTSKWKKLITLTGIAAFGIATLFSPAATTVAEAAAEETSISPYAHRIAWRYKEENGKLYRRLYNYTTASWVGEWQYVCDL